MFKSLDEKDKKKYKIIISILSILLILVLAVIGTLAWFSLGDSGDEQLDLSIGKVSYIVNTADKVFYSAFELENNDYEEDDFDPEEGIIPAQSISSLIVGTTGLNDDDGYNYSLLQGTRIKVKPELNPTNSTDKITYSSSNSNIVSVSSYGTISAIGKVGEKATITIKATDRTTDNTKRDDITEKLVVTIVTNPNPDNNKYGYLPGDVNILRDGLKITNLSTVQSKVRIKISWQYNNYDDDDEDTKDYEQYTVDELMKDVGETTGKIIVGQSLSSPLVLKPNNSFKSVEKENSNLYIVDENDYKWNIDKLFLKPTEYKNIVDTLKNNQDYTLSAKMIDSAYTYICYTNGDELDNSTNDYGAIVDKTSLKNGIEYNAVDELKTSTTYAGFSLKKAFSVNVTIQARQGKFYDEKNWYDVYCEKEDFGKTNHKVVINN